MVRDLIADINENVAKQFITSEIVKLGLREGLTTRKRLRDIIKWCHKVERSTEDLSFDDLMKMQTGIQLYQQNNKHKSITTIDKFKIFALSEEAAVNAFQKYCRTKTSKIADPDLNFPKDNRSLKYFVDKFGDTGHQMYEESNERNKASNYRCAVFWTNKGLTEQEAEEKISSLQRTFSLEQCIERLGEEQGRKRWLDRQAKWQKTLLEKPLQEQKDIREKKNTNSIKGWMLKGFSYEDAVTKTKEYSRNFSNESIQIFERYFKISERSDCLFGKNELKIINPETLVASSFDLAFPVFKVIVEYHGVAFHANPNWDISRLESWRNAMQPNFTYKDSLARDSSRRLLAESQGWIVFEIYSDDIRESTINDIIRIIGPNLL